jgi:hypothetical protein
MTALERRQELLRLRTQWLAAKHQVRAALPASAGWHEAGRLRDRFGDDYVRLLLESDVRPSHM